MVRNIIISLTLFCANIFCQSSEFVSQYRSDLCRINAKTDFSYSLLLNKNMEYNLYIIVYYEDTMDKMLVSSGKYEMTAIHLLLFDTYNKYSFEFNIKNNVLCLSSQSRFFNLKNIILKESKVRDKEFFVMKEDIFIKRERNQANNKIPHIFFYGTYCFGDIELVLTSQNEYTYSIMGYILSEGTFIWKNNELILYDKNMNHQFYFFIENKKLKDNLTGQGDYLYYKGK